MSKMRSRSTKGVCLALLGARLGPGSILDHFLVCMAPFLPTLTLSLVLRDPVFDILSLPGHRNFPKSGNGPPARGLYGPKSDFFDMTQNRLPVCFDDEI